jgi:type I protein arginine methyltransferase
LKKTITPDSVVVDIGTGTGIFALLACQFGARKVYAIEPNDLIGMARRIAHENGFSDRIEFFHQLSTSVKLPEKADVIVSDLRGVLPVYNGNLPSVIDARRRLLKEGGALIPQRDMLYVALVSAPKLYANTVGPWQKRKFNLQMEAARRSAVNAPRGTRLRPRQVLAEPALWAEIDYQTVQDPNLQGTVEFTVQDARRAHGLGMWFETRVLGDLGYSTGPFSPRTVYGQMFFPFERPLRLAPGDTVSVTLSANQVGADYIWRWDTLQRAASQVTARFEQSSFYSTPLMAEKLRKMADQWQPTLTPQAQADRLILELMDGEKTIAEIARAVREQFPQRFPSLDEALERAKHLSAKYSQ